MVEEKRPDGKDADKADPYANDPFFKRIFDGQWNACIGRQGHEAPNNIGAPHMPRR